MNILHTLGLMKRSEHEREINRVRSSLNGTIDRRETTIDELIAERNEALAKFKRATADLAAQAEEIKRLTRGWDNCGDELNQVNRERDALQRAVDRLNVKIDEHRKGFAGATSEIERLLGEIADIRPDAEAMRKKRAADRKRMAGKRGKA